MRLACVFVLCLTAVGARAGEDIERIRALTEPQTTFAIDLYRLASDSRKNVVIAPLLPWLLGAVLHEGAGESNAKEISAALNLSLPEQELREGSLLLFQHLNRQAKGDGVELTVTNGMWLQRGLQLQPEFLRVVTRHYAVNLKATDFRGDAQAEINRWIAEQTRGRIRNLYQSPGDYVVMAMVSALYFQGQWAEEFPKRRTQRRPFSLRTNTKVKVPTMAVHLEKHLVGRTELVYYIDLDYRDCSFAMRIVLPRPGKLQEVEAALSADLLRGTPGEVILANVNLQLPRFNFEQQVDLADLLPEMGMVEAFTQQADFSRMAERDDDPLFVSRMLQRSGVEVDEEGSVAYGAAYAETEFGFGDPSTEPPTINFYVDRPFLFTIYDRPSGVILFLGRVTNPLR